MHSAEKTEMSQAKRKAIENFHDHVSSGKVSFYRQLNMEYVPGRREGPYLWDMDNEKRLFNLHTNGGTYNLGHRNPEVIKVLRAGLEEMDIGNGHLISKARADAAELLADLMPGDLEYTVFGVGGGEAVDLAIKVARAYTERTGIISALGGYHGHTGLAMAAGDEKYRAPVGPQPPGFQQVPFDDSDALDKAMDHDTAAVILETIPATLGMPIPQADYFKKIRAMCDAKGALLIIDEVQTGLGRTGKLWAFEHFDVIPDMVVLGKGLSGGIYPITATVLRSPLESVFHADPHIHVSTFGGSELGCLVACKVLEISSAPDFLDRVNQLATYFAQGIAGLREKHALLTGFRRLGLFMGLEMEDEDCGPLLSLAAYQHDLLMVYANNCKSVCQFLPPLTIDGTQVEYVIRQLDKALTTVREFKKIL